MEDCYDSYLKVSFRLAYLSKSFTGVFEAFTGVLQFNYVGREFWKGLTFKYRYGIKATYIYAPSTTKSFSLPSMTHTIFMW